MGTSSLGFPGCQVPRQVPNDKPRVEQEEGHLRLLGSNVEGLGFGVECLGFRV